LKTSSKNTLFIVIVLIIFICAGFQYQPKSINKYLYFGEASENTNSNADQLHLAISRVYHEEKCIIGELYKINQVAGSIMPRETFLAYTLELPYTFNFNDISSIPVGTYHGDIRTDGKRGWRIQLENVPGRKYIQIHIGNFPKDITGCILVGTSVKDNEAGKCHLVDSASAIKKVETEFIIHDALLGLGKSCPLMRVKLDII